MGNIIEKNILNCCITELIEYFPLRSARLINNPVINNNIPCIIKKKTPGQRKLLPCNTNIKTRPSEIKIEYFIVSPHYSNNASNCCSVNILTPRFFALSNLEPGLVPVTR